MTARPAAPEDVVERPLRLRGNRLARALLRLLGWQLDFDGLPARQGVIVVYPHTSNWDFPLGMLAKWGMGLQVQFWGKASLFKLPLFGNWLRWVGGIGIDRQAPGGIVAATVQRMQQARRDDDVFWLTLAPEGTRAAGAGWRSGFYRVATESEVPVALAYLDFGRKRVGIRAAVRLCGRPDDDMAAIARHYDGVRGYRHQDASPIRLA